MVVCRVRSALLGRMLLLYFLRASVPLSLCTFGPKHRRLQMRESELWSIGGNAEEPENAEKTGVWIGFEPAGPALVFAASRSPCVSVLLGGLRSPFVFLRVQTVHPRPRSLAIRRLQSLFFQREGDEGRPKAAKRGSGGNAAGPKEPEEIGGGPVGSHPSSSTGFLGSLRVLCVPALAGRARRRLLRV